MDWVEKKRYSVWDGVSTCTWILGCLMCVKLTLRI